MRFRGKRPGAASHLVTESSPKSSAAAPPPVNPAASLSLPLLALNWLVPGAGWMARGRFIRGMVSFALVLATFALGLTLHGGVSWPSWNIRSEAFNLINNFTFVIQLGAGLPALASLAADAAGFKPLGGIPQDAWYELGSFYIVVAGAINYFSTCNLFDRLMNPRGRFAAQELGLAEPPEADESSTPSASAPPAAGPEARP